MARKTRLSELATEAGGYYIRPAGAGCLVRWPDGIGGEVRYETRRTLEQACDECVD